MAVDPVSTISGSSGTIDPTSALALNNNQISALLVSGNLDPKFATLLLSQMSTNNTNSILFGGAQEGETADIFGMQGLVPDNLLGTTSTSNTDIFGGGAFNNTSPQFELSVYSSLIGKTAKATNPMTGLQIEGVVKSVSLQNGVVMLEINGINIPTANLLSIKQGG